MRRRRYSLWCPSGLLARHIILPESLSLIIATKSTTQKNRFSNHSQSPLTETTTIFNVPRGTAYITAQQLVINASSFVYYIFLTRIFNLSQIGEISVLAAVCAVFT